MFGSIKYKTAKRNSSILAKRRIGFHFKKKNQNNFIKKK